jgi:molecular chaperone IbpA
MATVPRKQFSRPDSLLAVLTDVGPIWNRMLGFDPFLTMLQRFSDSDFGNYPPYDIVQSPDRYEVILAVAGYSKDQLKVELDSGNVLRIKGTATSEGVDEVNKVIHQGIARRAFEQAFQLGPTVNVTSMSATLRDGMLRIVLNLEPEPTAEGPKLIPIQT